MPAHQISRTDDHRSISPVPFPITSSSSPSNQLNQNHHHNHNHNHYHHQRSSPSFSSPISSDRPTSWSLSSISQFTLNHSPIKFRSSSVNQRNPIDPKTSLSLLNSRPSSPPSPTPRDDVIEGMSLSTGSIFERDVENFLSAPGLDAQQATQLAIPPVLDQAIEVLSTTDHPQSIIVDQIPFEAEIMNRYRTLSKASSSISQPRKIPSSSKIKTSNKSVRTNKQSHKSKHMIRNMIPFQLSTDLPGNLPSNEPMLITTNSDLNPSSDSNTISGPSSPRSLSPTPSFGLGRSMINSFSETELLSSTAPSSSNTQPPTRPTRLSFMSYADLINSERLEWTKSNSFYGIGSIWIDPLAQDGQPKEESEVLSERI